MSNRIKILSEDLANKIAAGEVVERPAAVVKELLENAIDAGSTRITVEIKSGGKQFIRVIDNGFGMTREDAVLAFARHATSKLSDVDDLSRIGTLGFRGEALPSIASVSKVEMTTNTQDGVAGTRIRIEGGQMLEAEDVGRAPGTTVTISHLFYNVPARRKFLRGADTEQRHVVNVLTSTALAYPEIAFTLMADGREALSMPSAPNHYARCRAVIGDTAMNTMIPLMFEDQLLRLNGFICRPDAARIARTNQHLFINLRSITSRLINHAVYQGYGTLLPKDKYPFSILYLAIDLDQVDVNVHPTKREVRFSNDTFIHERVIRATRLALQSSDIVPDFQSETPMIAASVSLGLPTNTMGGGLTGDSTLRAIGRRVQIDLFTALNQTPRNPSEPWVYTPGKELSGTAVGQDETNLIENDHADPSTTRAPETQMVSLWQLHNAYIFASIKGGLVVIDQHSAHERILYEKALETLSESSGSAQQLLFSITVDLPLLQFALVKEHMDLFNRLGFSVKLFGGQTVVIDAVPAFGRADGETTLFQRMIDELEHLPTADLKPEEQVALAFANRAGITKGTPLSQSEMNALMNDLFATSMPYFSPRGRPIVARMSMEEVERKFNKPS